MNPTVFPRAAAIAFASSIFTAAALSVATPSGADSTHAKLLTGDSIVSFARRHGLTLTQLRRLNPGINRVGGA